MTLPFEVLGYTPKRKIVINHQGHMFDFGLNQLNAENLSLLVGNNYDFAKLRAEIINLAHEKGVLDD